MHSVVPIMGREYLHNAQIWEFCIYCITKLGHEPIDLRGPTIVSLLNEDPAKTRVPFIIDVLDPHNESALIISSALKQKFCTSSVICDIPENIPDRINSLNESFSLYKSTQISDYLRSAIHYIFKQIANSKLSLNEIVSFACTNKDKLEHAFKRTYDKSVWQVVIDIRIQEARRLLLETNYPIGDIAISVGMPDPSVFGRTFQKITGSTPSKFRKKVD